MKFIELNQSTNPDFVEFLTNDLFELEKTPVKKEYLRKAQISAISVQNINGEDVCVISKDVNTNVYILGLTNTQVGLPVSGINGTVPDTISALYEALFSLL